MADIQLVAQWLGSLLITEAKYLSAVEGKVHELRDELYWVQCFLRDVAARNFDSVIALRLVSQIREFNYEAEDIIDEYLYKVDTNTGGRVDFKTLVKKYTKILWKYNLVRNIGKDIDNLRYKISLLTSKLQTYGIIRLEAMRRSPSSRLLGKNHTFNSSEEKKMIGRDNDLKELVDRLLDSGTNRESIVSICGVGGVGKTFLAKKIFNNTEIRKHFDAFAWAYVSDPCQISKVQQDLLNSLTSKSKQQISRMSYSVLKDELCNVQRKCKCFIVLDGLWGMEVWDRLKESFPIANSNVESKLLITIRTKEVAEHICQVPCIHELRALSTDVGKLLLEEMVNDPPVDSGQLHETAKRLKYEMLKQCEGLPLAISILAGVLATKKTVEEWQDVHKHIKSISIDDHQINQNSPNWKRILELSYDELPYQLKPSFLHLGYFLRNVEIPTDKIIRLWEAEGIVSFDGDAVMAEYTLEAAINLKRAYTLEYVAQCCLGELVERSLVQVGSRSSNGKAKTCLIHSHIRDLCVAKTSLANLLSIVPISAAEEDQHSLGQSFRNTSKKAVRNFRRMSVYYSTISAKHLFDYGLKKDIRYQLFFKTPARKVFSLETNLKKNSDEYKLLKVLDIENSDIVKFPKEIGHLIHLRYLSIRGTVISRLPSTIRNLKCLQTLDLRVLPFVSLGIPDVLSSMERLIHLYLPSKTFTLLHSARKLELKKLRNLETLLNFSNNCRAEDVKELINLRRFSSCDYLRSLESIKPLLDPGSSHLEHLEHVSIGLDSEILNGDPNALKSYRELRKLWVKGVVHRFTSDMLPRGIVHISLNNSVLREDPMQVLGGLPHLKKLSLENAAYVGTSMRCSPETFRELEYLFLENLPALEDWTIEEAAMQNLSYLEIHDCQKLKMIPAGLKSIQNLKELSISYMPWTFFDRLNPQEIKTAAWVDFQKVQHVPCFTVSHILDLNYTEGTVELNLD